MHISQLEMPGLCIERQNRGMEIFLIGITEIKTVNVKLLKTCNLFGPKP